MNNKALSAGKIVALAVFTLAFALPVLSPTTALASYYNYNSYDYNHYHNDYDNNYYYHDNHNDNNYNLTVSCSPSTNSVDTGDSMTWRASVSGGNGIYSYSWSGTDNLRGSSAFVEKTYNNQGRKYASVTVASGNKTANSDCDGGVDVTDNNYYYNNNDNNNYNNYDNLSVVCSPNTRSADVGNSITWHATVSGGNGVYSYNWSGTDSLWGSSSYIYKNYYTTGYKSARVTIASGGRTVSSDCLNYVNIGNYNGNYNNNYSNSNLDVTCTANISSSLSGNDVTWTAVPTGGNGGYTYAWSGDDSLSGSNVSVTKTYWFLGAKSATVTVTSNGYSTSRLCSNTVSISARPSVDYSVGYIAPAPVANATGDLVVACSPNTNNANINDTVVWISDIQGGNGKYVYKWDGSDNLIGDMNYLAKSYFSDGAKTAVLTVTSGGKTATKICSALMIGSVNNQTASVFFGNWTGTFIIILLLAIIIFLGLIMYFLNIRDREQMMRNGSMQ